MKARKRILALTLAGACLLTTQAGAFFAGYDDENDRPPPNGLNGASMSGIVDDTLTNARSGVEQRALQLKSVTLPDGTRIYVK